MRTRVAQAATVTAFAILAALFTIAPAHAVGGGTPDGGRGCDTATQPAPIARTEAHGDRVIIKARVILTASVCNPLSGRWVVTDMRQHVYKMLNRELGCRTFTREGDILDGTLTPWHPTGSATNC